MAELWLTLLAGTTALTLLVCLAFLATGPSRRALAGLVTWVRWPRAITPPARKPRAADPEEKPALQQGEKPKVLPRQPVAEPGVRRFVIDLPPGGREREPRLPARVAVGSGWHGSFFYGWCGSAAGPRSTSQLTVRGLTMRGATHAGLDAEGQDAIGATWDDARSALYVAVADGLGSLPRSGPVALHAINAALHMCVNRPGDIEFADAGPRLFAGIAAGLVRSLSEDPERLDGACTLVVAEIKPRFDGADVTVHGVGDSEAWALYAGGWTPLHHERGATDNSTRSLPAQTDPLVHRYHLSPGSVVVLGSDGFTAALDDSGSFLGRGLARYWRMRPSWLEFVNHVSFVDEYWSDDRSAVAVWIGEGTPDA